MSINFILEYGKKASIISDIRAWCNWKQNILTVLSVIASLTFTNSDSLRLLNASGNLKSAAVLFMATAQDTRYRGIWPTASVIQLKNCKCYISSRLCVRISQRWLSVASIVDGMDDTLNFGHQRDYFSSPRWKISKESHGGMILAGKTLRTRRKACPSVTLSTKNPTWTVPDSKQGVHQILHHGQQATP
jgi:hypothetical protein